MILPSKGHVTELVIRHFHADAAHVETEQTLAGIRQRFWVLHGKSAVRRALKKCVTCTRFRGRSQEQVMGMLVGGQLAVEPPFTHVGVDYFGPFSVKVGCSTCKRWVCIFTCIAMRAVHLEVAHSLSSDSFLSALSRFVARRGRPRYIYSDNGTNFVAANKELNQSLTARNEKVHGALLQQGVDWNFNPPHSSHRGGLWERLIRSVRSVLAVLLQDRTLMEEAFVTVMTEVEGVLNSRPLTSVSSDGRDPGPDRGGGGYGGFGRTPPLGRRVPLEKK